MQDKSKCWFCPFERILISILISATYLGSLSAQECTLSTGGFSVGGGSSISYSVGQTAYTTNNGNTGSVSQGVQQPYEISVINRLKDVSYIDLQLSAYPNPTAGVLILSNTGKKSSNGLSYNLIDLRGSLLESKKVVGNHTEINMSRFVPSTYLLNVIQYNKIIKVFKIEKK